MDRFYQLKQLLELHIWHRATRLMVTDRTPLGRPGWVTYGAHRLRIKARQCFRC